MNVAAARRADGKPFPSPKATAKLWVPVPGGPAFLLGPNFYAVRSYNPSMNYTLAIVHLADVINGAELVAAKTKGSAALVALLKKYPGDPAVLKAIALAYSSERNLKQAIVYTGQLFAIAPAAAMLSYSGRMASAIANTYSSSLA